MCGIFIVSSSEFQPIMVNNTRVHTSTDSPSNERSGLTEGSGSSRVKRRRFLQTAAAAGVITSTAGCLDLLTDDDDDIGDEIKIGMLAQQPEEHPVGAAQAAGAELAVNQLNEEDGILGTEVELLTRNTDADASTGLSRYRDLVIEEGVDMTTGIFQSEVLLNIMDDIRDQQTLHLTAGAGTSQTGGMINENYDDYKYHFRIGPINDYFLAQHMLQFGEDKFDEMGWDSIAVLVEDFAWTEPISDVFDDDLGDLEVEIVENTRYAGDTEDFGPIYGPLAQQGIDGAFTVMAHTGDAAVVTWSRGEMPFGFGGIHVGMQLPAYWQLTEGDCTYGFTQTSATPQTALTSKTQPFAQAYIEAFDTAPVYTGYIAYDAIMLYAEMVEQEETTDSDVLVDALEEVEWEATTGTLEFYDSDHQFAHDPIYGEDHIWPVYIQWQLDDEGQGVQEVIYPDEHATAEYISPPWV